MTNNFQIVVLGLVVVFMVLAVLFIMISLMHVVINAIETNIKARQAWKLQQQTQAAEYEEL